MDATHPEAAVVVIGGEPYTIKLSLGALRLAKVKHGREFTLSSFVTDDLTVLLELAWVGMLPDRPGLSEEDAAVLLAQHPEAEYAVLEAVGLQLVGIIEQLARLDAGPAGKAMGAAQKNQRKR